VFDIYIQLTMVVILKLMHHLSIAPERVSPLCIEFNAIPSGTPLSVKYLSPK
jgi:hypothetical protein